MAEGVGGAELQTFFLNPSAALLKAEWTRLKSEELWSTNSRAWLGTGHSRI